MNPKVTGCIVTYNNMKTIKKAIDTILEYTDGNFRLYVVDNNSTDGTPKFIRENYPEVCVIETGTNSGFGAGHNIVLPMLSSEYHIIINPDIVIAENAIEKIIDFMDENPDIGLLSPRICFPPDGRVQILGKRNPRLKYLIASRMRDENNPSKLLKEYAMLDCDLSDVTDIENATGCFMVFRTSVFKELKGFDEGYFMYFEDADISRRAKKITRVVFYPHATILHEWGRESKRNFKLMLIHIQSMFRYFFKWKTI